MVTTITIQSVDPVKTRGGNVRYVVRDSEGKEYVTFREAIGEKATGLEGRRVQIEYHEQQRGEYTNVYLDKVEADPEKYAGRRESDTDPEEAAWRTAVDAAPWLLGESDPHAKTSPEERYATLKPFKERVAEDIKETDSG
jgi:hypothetical protein